MYDYDLKCKKCGFVIVEPTDKDYRMVNGERRFPKCLVCNEAYMHNVVAGVASAGDYHHVSDSLGIHPSQIAEHKKLFPHIEVTADGRPCFNSPRQQERYANACGFDKKPQKNRRRGVRL